ncbi:hypothetical protein RFI_32613, partial [Reticulomyxa filosa]
MLEGNPNKLLDDFLISKSGNWAKQVYQRNKDSTWTPKHCMPYCATVPYSLVPFHPLLWNVGFRIMDYLWNNDLAASGWELAPSDNEQQSWFDDKIGGQASNDHKFLLFPLSDDFANFKRDFDTNNESRHGMSWDDFCLTKGYDLRVSIKIPLNGDGSLLLTTGLSRNDYGSLYNIYLETIGDVNLTPDQKWFLGKELSSFCDQKDISDNHAVGCHIHNLPKGIKYLIHIVVKNVENKETYNQGVDSFLVAYLFSRDIEQISRCILLIAQKRKIFINSSSIGNKYRESIIDKNWIRQHHTYDTKKKLFSTFLHKQKALKNYFKLPLFRNTNEKKKICFFKRSVTH